MNFYFFNFIVAGRSAHLGIPPPPEWMGSRWHHHPVANNIIKKVVKGQGTKPCHPPFLHHFLIKKFIFFQFHCCRVVRTTGDISAPRMNGKLATSSPCCQQHYQEDGKRARYKTMPSTFSTPFSHYWIFIISISLLQGGPHNCGYICPQNEWEAGNTIALLPTLLPRRC